MTADCGWNHGSVVRRLALACTRGPKQASLVNELLVGSAPIGWYVFGQQSHREYGVSKVQGSSFRNLRRRLVQAGFVVVVDNIRNIVSIKFPEEQY